MKCFRLYLTTLVAAFMVACSSMEVDDNELYSENYPKDFVDSVYINLHPELIAIHVKNYVKSYNQSIKDSLSAEKYEEMFAEDTAAFLGDTAQLHELYINSRCLGFSEDAWSEIWEQVPTSEETCNVSYTYKKVFLIIDTTKVKIFVDSVLLNDEGNFKTFYGRIDSTGTTQKFDLGDSIKYFNQGAEYDSVAVCDTNEVMVDGSLSAVEKSLLMECNFVGKSDDLKALEKVSYDKKAVVYQYLVYGRSHGWTYRYCTAAEKKNPIRPILDASESTDKLYCDDNGVAREIK